MKRKKNKPVKSKIKKEISIPLCGFTVTLPTELGLPQPSKADILEGVGGVVASQISVDTAETQCKTSETVKTPENNPDLSTLRAVLCKIATNAWRAENKMRDDNTGVIREDVKRIYRHIESIFDGLTEAGIEKIDYTGKPYNSGLTLKVISFEPTPGLTREIIKETISPTIHWHGKLIQTGEVIVGTPQA